jgi:hypothetical protein
MLLEERQGARMRNIRGLFLFVIFSLVGTVWPELSGATPPEDQSEQASFDDVAHPPGTPSVPSAARPASKEKSPKVHKWTGSLVDSICMADALRQVPSLDQILFPEPLSQYYLQALQGSQRTSQGTGSGISSPQGQPHPPGPPSDSPGSNGDPETSERELAMQAAQLRRAELMDHQVKVCTPSPPTSHFGLFVSDGYLLKFDAAGDFRAMKALKASVLQPGKAVKAKVTGVLIEEEDLRN